MDGLEEMLRLEEVGDAVKRLVIDEDSAKQRLLGLDIVRCDTERRLRRRLLACGRIEYRHDRSDESSAVADLRHMAEIRRVKNLGCYSTSWITQRQRHTARLRLRY